MHPFIDAKDAVVTWSNPLSGMTSFEFEGLFWHVGCDNAGVEVSISRSEAGGVSDTLLTDDITGLSSDAVHLQSGDDPDLVPDNDYYSFTLDLDEGDEIHFRVNCYDTRNWSDSTMFGCQVAQIPEPSTLILLVSAIGVLAMFRRRRPLKRIRLP